MAATATREASYKLLQDLEFRTLARQLPEIMQVKIDDRQHCRHTADMAAW